MKKYIAFILCLIMILSFFSCGKENMIQDTNKLDQNKNTENISNNVSNNTAIENYRSILETYRLIVEKFSVINQNPLAVAAELGIQSEAEKEAFVNLYSSIHLFYPGRGQEDSLSPHYKLGCGYAQKDFNGDGVDELILLNSEYYVMAIFSYADGKPVLLGNYRDRNSCWIDGDGLIHNNGSSGADYSTNAVYKIADGGKELELIVEYGTNGHEWIKDVGYTIYYKLVDEEKKTITEAEYQALDKQYGKYLGSVAGVEATKQHSGLTFTSLYTEAEVAMEMYEAVLENEIKVYETDTQEYNNLADCKTPYESILLRDCENLRYAYTDIDGDSTEELVIDCGDALILRYYEGVVYLYSFTFRQLSHLNIDGSYSWNYTGQNFEYGCNQIYFEGAELKSKGLWCVVNDGEPNAEYYIKDKQVSKEEFLKNINYGPELQLQFEPLEVSWQKEITDEEALQIASEYWGIEDGFTDYGAGSMWTFRIMILDPPSLAWGYYHIGLQIDHYGRDHNDLRVLIESKMEHLFVGSVTGKCQEHVPIYSEK